MNGCDCVYAFWGGVGVGFLVGYFAFVIVLWLAMRLTRPEKFPGPMGGN